MNNIRDTVVIIPSEEQLEEMKQVFEMFIEKHTTVDRSAREMFYHGYYMAMTKQSI